MNKILYKVLFLTFFFLLIWVFYKSEIQGLGEQRSKYEKYYIFFGSFFLLFLTGFFVNKIINKYILIGTLSFILGIYIFEGITIYSSYKNIKIKENLHNKKYNTKYDKRSLIEYFKFRKKTNKEIKVAVYPDSSNRKKNIDIFPLSGISKKETILCNENGYFVSYESDRYGFNNQDSEWDKNIIEYLILGDSLVHGFCVKQKNNMTSILKKISNKSAINLSYGGNGPLIEYASLKEFTPQNVKKIIWTYSEWNDLIDINFEYSNSILNKYYYNSDYSQNLKQKQNIIDDMGNKLTLKSVSNYNSLKNFIFLNNLRFLISKKTKIYIPEKNFLILENILIKFINFSRENNSIPYFVYIPSYNTFVDEINKTNYLKVKKIINKLDIEFIDIRNEIIEDKINIQDLFPYKLPGHYSEIGYEYITKKIYQKTN